MSSVYKTSPFRLSRILIPIILFVVPSNDVYLIGILIKAARKKPNDLRAYHSVQFESKIT